MHFLPLVVLFAAVLTACSISVSASRSPEEPVPAALPMPQVESERYEIYAPSEESARTAREDMEHAVARFTRYFGTPPARIAVVLFDSPHQLAAYDFSPFEQRGIPALPWLTEQALQATVAGARAGGGDRMRVEQDLGLVLVADTAAGVQVRATIPFAKPQNVDLSAGDRILTLDRQPLAALAEWDARYGDLPAGTPVVLEVERAGERVEVRFPKPAADPTRRVTITTTPQPRHSPPAEMRALSHEACHVFLILYVSERLGRTAEMARRQQAGRRTYGDPALPDWFDEAVATLCEGSALQAQRRARMVENIAERIPLAQFFTMEHPSLAEPRAAEGERIVVAPATSTAPLFYPQALTLAEFLVEREGPQFIRHLADGLAQGRSMPELLAEARHVPLDLEELEREWVAWLARRSGEEAPAANNGAEPCRGAVHVFGLRASVWCGVVYAHRAGPAHVSSALGSDRIPLQPCRTCPSP